MTYFLGVDAGNTKTIALVAHADGHVVGTGRSGCGDIYVASRGEEIPSVNAAVEEALSAAGLRASEISAGGFSMAGADYAEDFTFIESAMRRASYGKSITVVNDGIGPLWANAEDGVGVAVTCGTGAATGARNADGRLWHSSFWQNPTGGHDLGWKVLHAAFAAELGTGPKTALSERVLVFFGESDVEQILHRLTRRGAKEGHKVRHLVVELLNVAHESDPVATRIVQAHGEGLGAIASVAARKVGLGDEPFPLVLAGGVLRHHTHLLADALVGRVRAEMPLVQPVVSRFEPVVGALLMAMASAGLPTGTATHQRIAETMPGSELFKSDE